jgi:dipeptidyl aminopeptidase/acylaminoacyl peptidase
VGGGWPATGDDVLAALDFIPGLGIGPGRTVVIGHSAGGYLGMWATEASTTKIDRVVALAPVVDLEIHARSGMFGAVEAQLLLDDGAPAQVDPGDTPTFLVHGENDRHVPIEPSMGLAARAGLDLITTETGHFELLDPSRESWSPVLEVLGITTRHD